MKVLLIPQWSGDFPIENTCWNHLSPAIKLTILKFPEKKFILNNLTQSINLEDCLNLVAKYINDYDYIIGHANAFLWLSIFRLAGSKIPFAIIPDINHINSYDSFALLLASQLRIPKDIIFSGSQSAGRSFNMYKFNYDGTYPPGIPLELFRPMNLDKVKIKKDLGISDNHFILTYTGRLAPDKSILELIEVFDLISRYKNVSLLLCYHMHDPNYLDLCIKKSRHLNNIYFIRNPNQLTLAQYYNIADLFITMSTSIYETFGRSPIEAMACGTIPIVPAYNGFKETINNSCGLLIPTIRTGNNISVNPMLISEAIMAALSNESIVSRMSLSAMNHAKKYDSKLTINQMENKLNHILCSHDENFELNKEIKLDEYPICIKNMWGSLDKNPIKILLEQFLKTNCLPVNPSKIALQEYRYSWLSHY